MCGIAGIFGESDEEVVKALTLALKHRGPDSTGFYSRGDLHLGITRLRIIDLEHGDQPIFNEIRDKVIVFNGEIYNHRELRETLTAAGHTFSTRTDTEVILHLYEEYGERCVEHLRGMFAFAIADGDTLFLARDRLGIKPLYYAFVPERNLFLFASECKALLRCRHVPAELNRQAFADRSVLTYVPGRQTLFRGIECVLPGETMTVARGQEGALSLRTRQYYRLSWAREAAPAFEECRENLIDLFRTTVSSHMVSDVDVALTLSGGLDSSFLALTIGELTDRELLTFTVGGDEAQRDVVYAKWLGRYLKTRHDIRVAGFSDFLEAIPAFILAEERASNLWAMPAFLLFRRVGEHVKVCMNGEGADELFGGYPEYKRPCFFLQSFRRRLEAAERRGLPVSDEAAGIVRQLNRNGSRDQCLQKVFDLNLTARLVYLHLDLADRLGMASSVEVRVPFMDHVLVEFVNRLPASYKVDGNSQKVILKAAAVHAFGDPMARVAARKKNSFPHASSAHLRQFDSLCEELLPRGYLSDHEMGAYFPGKASLLVFDLFHHIFFERRGELDAGFQVMDFLRTR